ncbi:MAG: hypothetical protein Q8P13_02740 [bacterium]|nr:hypothetical protein [bacterium]
MRDLMGEKVAGLTASETDPLNEAFQLVDVITHLKEWGLSQLTASGKGLQVGQSEGKTLYLTANGRFLLRVVDLEIPIGVQQAIDIFGFHSLNHAIGEAIIASLQNCRANNEYWAELSKRAEELLKAI